MPDTIPDGYAVLIERDEEYNPAENIAAGGDAADRAYVAAYRAGDITAYVVSLVLVDMYGDVSFRGPSIAGCDVGSGSADGLYFTLDEVPDEYLRDTARDLISEIPTGPCEYADGTHHSADLIKVWHGATTPAVLCGKHADHPIDWSKVRKSV